MDVYSTLYELAGPTRRMGPLPGAQNKQPTSGGGKYWHGGKVVRNRRSGIDEDWSRYDTQ